jgi:FkbM family methyltransferase
MSIATRIAGMKAMMRFDNRWQLIANRLFFQTDMDIYRYRGCKLLVDYGGGDAAGVRECLTSDMYRQLLPYLDLPGAVSILDCGANGGGFPLLFHTEGHGLSTVVSVEMNPYTFLRLQYNLKNNLDASVHCLNMIVEDTAREHAIRFGNGSTGDSILHESGKGKQFSIRSTSIDALIGDYFKTDTIDIAKIDIEGAEYLVFSGSNHNLLQQCRYIVIEIHTVAGHAPSDVKAAITALGFDMLFQDADVYLFANQRIR